VILRQAATAHRQEMQLSELQSRSRIDNSDPSNIAAAETDTNGTLSTAATLSVAIREIDVDSDKNKIRKLPIVVSMSTSSIPVEVLRYKTPLSLLLCSSGYIVCSFSFAVVPVFHYFVSFYVFYSCLTVLTKCAYRTVQIAPDNDFRKKKLRNNLKRSKNKKRKQST
jgi:hypothetical protein